MAPREDFCKTCGLFAPCPTCGKGRAALSVVPSEPAYTEAQIRSAVDRAWKLTPHDYTADGIMTALKEGGS